MKEVPCDVGRTIVEYMYIDEWDLIDKDTRNRGTRQRTHQQGREREAKKRKRQMKAGTQDQELVIKCGRDSSDGIGLPVMCCLFVLH